MISRRPIITRAGKERLEQELQGLRARRPEMLERLREARESAHGDTADLTEYGEIQRERALLESRIAELERLLAEAEVVETPVAQGEVRPGSTVVVRDEADEGEVERYTLVGPAEADPAHGRISVESPVGRALLGRRAGEVVEVDTPAGRRRLRLEAVQ